LEPTLEFKYSPGPGIDFTGSFLQDPKPKINVADTIANESRFEILTAEFISFLFDPRLPFFDDAKKHVPRIV
jgi:hypothetical protein